MDSIQIIEHLTLSELMTGNMPFHYWLALFLFYLIGATIYQGSKVSKGIREKTDSPQKFSLGYFFKDPQNYIDFFVATLSAYIFLRFADKLLNISENIEWLLLASVGLGILWQFLADKLIDLLRKLIAKATDNPKENT